MFDTALPRYSHFAGICPERIHRIMFIVNLAEHLAIQKIKGDNEKNQTDCFCNDNRDGARLPALALAAGGAEVRANQD